MPAKAEFTACFISAAYARIQLSRATYRASGSEHLLPLLLLGVVALLLFMPPRQASLQFRICLQLYDITDYLAAILCGVMVALFAPTLGNQLLAHLLSNNRLCRQGCS